MSFDAEQLYKLLPAIHRNRDSAIGAELARSRQLPADQADQLRPLRALIGALAGQVAVVEEHLEQLYDNHFVETAAPWALPYLGELLGIQGLPPLPALGGMVRAEVGHTMSYRRRKGTAAMLEQLARDTTQWPARAVEFFERLVTTQHVNHPRLQRSAWAALRDADALELVGTPFEPVTRTLEVRRVNNARGRWNIPNIGLFVWRLRTFSLTRAPLVPALSGDPRAFHLDPLGRNVQLLTRPRTEAKVEHLAEPADVPLPITRRLLADHDHPQPSRPLYSYPPRALYYGPDASVMLWEVLAQTGRGATELRVGEVTADRIIVADLSRGVPAQGPSGPDLSKKILLDPMLGRVVLPVGEPGSLMVGGVPQARYLASYYYGFSASLGGGEYNRAASFDRAELGASLSVSQLPPPEGDLPPDAADLDSALALVTDQRHIVEVLDSGRYFTRLPLVPSASGLEVRAADGWRPAILYPDAPAARAGGPTAFVFAGAGAAQVTLNGLLLAGAPIWLPKAADAPGGAALRRLIMRHCTHLPALPDLTRPRLAGWIDRLSLRVESPGAVVTISDSIVNALQVAPDVRVELHNCIVDAPGQLALGGLDGGPAGSWKLVNCTVLGNVRLRKLDLASNCIFAGAELTVEQRQQGCVRFSWLPKRARTPSPYECLTGAEDGSDFPQFTSLKYGDAGYAQLLRSNAPALLTGADDGSEMGVFHDLYQPQREAHLRTRLEEHLRFGLEAGLFFVT